MLSRYKKSKSKKQDYSCKPQEETAQWKGWYKPYFPTWKACITALTRPHTRTHQGRWSLRVESLTLCILNSSGSYITPTVKEQWIKLIFISVTFSNGIVRTHQRGQKYTSGRLCFHFSISKNASIILCRHCCINRLHVTHINSVSC